MRQFAGFGNARQTNERYHFLLAQGQMGLSVAFDMPTLMGYDSDAPQALGEVGRCGVAIDSVRDMETLFRGIDMGAITTSMTINGPAAIALAQYVVAAENQGVPRARLGGTLQADILKEYIAQKEWIFPPRPHVRIIVDMMKFCTAEMPKWNTISISGYHIREAGSTAVQELAFTLADGFAYVEAALKAGMDIDSFAPRLSFFFNAHIDFFEEICKFRAARRVYAHRMRDVYGAKDPRSWMLRFHTQTAGCSATAQQPENNIVRVAYEALSWGRHVNDHRDAWSIVTSADHPAVGLALNSFHSLARSVPTDSILTIDPARIFLVQLADAPLLDINLFQWNRHYSNMPGQGDLPIRDYVAALLRIGMPVSRE